MRDVILADTSMDEERTQAVAQVCAAAGACLQRFRVAIDPVPAPAGNGNASGNGNGARLVAWQSEAEAAARLEASLSPAPTAVLPSNAGSPERQEPTIGTLSWSKRALPE